MSDLVPTLLCGASVAAGLCALLAAGAALDGVARVERRLETAPADDEEEAYATPVAEFTDAELNRELLIVAGGLDAGTPGRPPARGMAVQLMIEAARRMGGERVVLRPAGDLNEDPIWGDGGGRG